MLPNRIIKVRMKRDSAKFDSAYFSKNSQCFKPPFLRRSPLERARMLSKVQKNAALTNASLQNILRQLNELSPKVSAANPPKFLRKRILELGQKSDGLYLSLMRSMENKNMFSDRYFDLLGRGRGNKVTNEHMRLIHRCVHLQIKINEATSFLFSHLR
ncbi:MAG: hypothetical protein WC602_04535 [archaeon]